MRVKVRYRGEVFEFNESMSVNKLLKKFSLTKGEAVVVRNGIVATEDELLLPNDDVRIINTVSGG